MRTYTPKPGEVTRAWHVIDASDVVLGRLASQVAILLRGKHKPQFAPHVDTGDFVVVVNAEKVVMTSDKRRAQFAYRHSGYPGGLRQEPTRSCSRKRPERVVEQAVKGMLPKNSLGRKHAHQAQGVRGSRPPARGAAAHPVRDHPDRAVRIPVTDPIAPTTTSVYDGPRLVQTVGRRKEAIVRVRLVPGTGQFTLNGRTLEEYFPNKVHQQLIREPLVTLEKGEQYDVIAAAQGRRHHRPGRRAALGIARALIEIEADDRPALKKAGFLTRDPRVKERKKYGLKKARKAPQYSKR